MKNGSVCYVTGAYMRRHRLRIKSNMALHAVDPKHTHARMK